MDDLAVSTVHAGMNLGRAGMSISCSSTGFDLYGEDHEKIGLSFSPFGGLSAGVRFTRYAMHIKNFGEASALSADAGVILCPFTTVCIAASYEDIANAELGESREPLDGIARCAASWSISEYFTLLSSATKVRRFEPSISGGFTMEMLDALTFGVVGGNEPDRFEFLGTVNVSGICFSYRGSHHRDMGMSHGFSLSWGGRRLFSGDDGNSQ